MSVKTEEDIIELIQADEWMMEIIHTAGKLHLPDWWICAGFVRSKIWDSLHHFEKRTKLSDVDVIYFDRENIDENTEKQLESELKRMFPDVPWSVKNEARMHLINGLPPYSSAVDAMAKFPETATALGIKADEKQNIVLAAPHGIKDVINLEVKPTPFFAANNRLMAIYQSRLRYKNWQAVWGKLKVYNR
ncbi:nucleotidyltransferase family protein [Sediminibacillus albus]|uniref:Nucleotidyltransferase family protein n=1 Tax=Sediminibacillus albus TaxID=407036 RepID=A0A1G8WR59_9BACI|nr:nucleotidyltransferase family protein [Sediminibacillus albus]SDJ80848.1 hypothetical protein SAMN05216243_0953 [Sediminibacillus albus]